MALSPFTSDGSEIMQVLYDFTLWTRWRRARLRTHRDLAAVGLGHRDSGLCRTRGCEHLEQPPQPDQLNPLAPWPKCLG